MEEGPGGPVGLRVPVPVIELYFEKDIFSPPPRPQFQCQSRSFDARRTSIYLSLGFSVLISSQYNTPQTPTFTSATSISTAPKRNIERPEIMSKTITDTDNKQEAEHHEMEQLGKVNSQDSLHRRELGRDATDLKGYWKSPRLIGSIAATFLLANSIFIGYAMPVNVLTVINADIGPSPNIYLISLVNSLFTGVLLLFFARLSDILGRRYFLIGAQVFGVIGSIVCATGNSVNVLIGGSVMTGIGGAAGLLYPVIIHELIPNKYRHWGQAAITVAVIPILGFGPAIARTMIAHTTVGWRGVYWLNVAVSGASVVLFATCYFPPDFHMINSELTWWKEVKSLDYGASLPSR